MFRYFETFDLRIERIPLPEQHKAADRQLLSHKLIHG